MSWRSPEKILLTLTIGALLAACAAGSLGEQEPPARLRVCADPDALPYSHRDGGGVHNRIAALLAQELRVELALQWVPRQGESAARTMMRRRCDLMLAVPAAGTRLPTTRPLSIAGDRSSPAAQGSARKVSMRDLIDDERAGMSIGVARASRGLLPRVERAIDARRAEIDRILASAARPQ